MLPEASRGVGSGTLLDQQVKLKSSRLIDR